MHAAVLMPKDNELGLQACAVSQSVAQRWPGHASHSFSIGVETLIDGPD